MNTIKPENKFSVDGRVWINSGECSFTGPGKIELLEKIKELGSLRKAASEMKMSYRQAWQRIDKMNKRAEQPLVILTRGGKDGGIAVVTEFADKVILSYKTLQSAFTKFIEEQSKTIHI